MSTPVYRRALDRVDDAIAELPDPHSARGALQDIIEHVQSLTTALQTAEQERDEWRSVACDFHDALVGKNMAGAFNHTLAERAMKMLDILEARGGRAHPEDAAELKRLAEHVRQVEDDEDRAEVYAQLRAAEARIRTLEEALGQAISLLGKRSPATEPRQ